jgi:hypothetical protein
MGFFERLRRPAQRLKSETAPAAFISRTDSLGVRGGDDAGNGPHRDYAQQYWDRPSISAAWTERGNPTGAAPVSTRNPSAPKPDIPNACSQADAGEASAGSHSTPVPTPPARRSVAKFDDRLRALFGARRR